MHVYVIWCDTVLCEQLENCQKNPFKFCCVPAVRMHGIKSSLSPSERGRNVGIELEPLEKLKYIKPHRHEVGV